MGIGGARVRGVAFCTHSRTLALRAFINRAAFQMSVWLMAGNYFSWALLLRTEKLFQDHQLHVL